MKPSNQSYPTNNAQMDYTLGSILALSSIAGTVMNTGAFLFFNHNRVRNQTNSEYFRRLFAIITANDIAISLSVFPVIDAAFSRDRHGFLFAQDWFCRTWFVLWHTVWQVSLVTVAVMSLSRFLVIKIPNCHLRPWVTRIFISSLLLCILVYWIIAICLELVFPRYYPGYLYCGVSLFRDMQGTVDTTFNIKHESGFFVRKGIISITTLSIVISFVTVITSFILTLFRLKVAKSYARSVGVSARRQYKAARTVIIFTFNTIVFSTPIMLVGLYMVIREIVHPLKPGSTGAEVMLRMSFNNHPVLEKYAWPVSMVMCTCLNSMVNPMIYYWRMRGFRTFINEIAMDCARRIRRKMATMPSGRREDVKSIKAMENFRIVCNTDPGRENKEHDDLIKKIHVGHSC